MKFECCVSCVNGAYVNGAGGPCAECVDGKGWAAATVERALATQVGGGHYKDMPIQPVEFIHKNGIGFAEGCAIKYLCRWRAKNGVEDLKKARHFIDLLIEMETERTDAD